MAASASDASGPYRGDDEVHPRPALLAFDLADPAEQMQGDSSDRLAQPQRRDGMGELMNQHRESEQYRKTQRNDDRPFLKVGQSVLNQWNK